MFKRLRRKVESQRYSSNIFWRLLVYIKDAFWEVNFLISQFFRFFWLYIYSWYRWWTDKKKFKSVDTYCMFIGYPRSGHSIIGSILDAHPNIIIAQELDTLNFLAKGFSLKQIFSLLWDNSKRFTKEGRIWEGYSYLVPNQWHSRFKTLQVIGDKLGGVSSARLKNGFEPYFKLKRRLKRIDLKIIHVYRNPYDTIATMSRKYEAYGLAGAIKHYFSLLEVVLKMKKEINDLKMLDIKQEDFIKNPKQTIETICKFLGVDAPADYLEAASKIVWSKPHQSRHRVSWSTDQIVEVKEKFSQANFLKDYSYED